MKVGEVKLYGHIQLKGVNLNILDEKVSGKDTDGSLALFEQIGLSQGRGTPLLFHHFPVETFF